MAGGVKNAAAHDDKAAALPIVKTSKLQDFLHFLYNKDEGKVLGRTGRSWCEIFIFYVIFYACLAGFFGANLAIFLSTLSDEAPRYYGKGSIIGINPGLGYQPWISKNADSTLIKFDSNDTESFKKYTDVLDAFFKKYQDINKDSADNELKQGFRICDETESNGDDKKKNENDEACVFPLTDFAGKCESPYFGFDEGEPCVILTLNKLIDWEPVKYPDESCPDAVPEDVRDLVENTGDIAVACEGEYAADKENIGKMTYLPKTGIKKQFFPYKIFNNSAYHQPFAMVKFEGLTPGVLVEVECKAYAYNIIHDRTNRLGMVHFELYHMSGPTDEDDNDDEEGSGS